MNDPDISAIDSEIHVALQKPHRRMKLITRISLLSTLLMVSMVPLAAVVSQIFMKITGENIRTENMLYIDNPIVLPFMQITSFLAPIVTALWMGTIVCSLKNKTWRTICSWIAVIFMVFAAYPLFLLGFLVSGLPEMMVATLFNAPLPIK